MQWILCAPSGLTRDWDIIVTLLRSWRFAPPPPVVIFAFISVSQCNNACHRHLLTQNSMHSLCGIVLLIVGLYVTCHFILTLENPVVTTFVVLVCCTAHSKVISTVIGVSLNAYLRCALPSKKSIIVLTALISLLKITLPTITAVIASHCMSQESKC